MRLLRTAWAFLVRDFQVEVSYRLSFILQLTGLFVSATLWFFMARFIRGVSAPGRMQSLLGGLDYYSFTIVGIMVNRFIEVAQSSYGAQIRSEQTTGTLEAMLVTPTRLAYIVLSASAWSYFFAVVQAGALLFFGVVVFKVQLHLGSLLAAFAAVLLSVLALSGIGILSAAFVLYFKRGNPVDFAISMISLLFGNLLIPPQALPPSLAWISKVIPVTYAADAVRGALLRRATLADLAPDLEALALFAAVLLPLGLLGARMAVRRAKREGTLVQY